MRPSEHTHRRHNKATDVSLAVANNNRVSCPWLPVSLSLFGDQLQETRMTGVEREGRIHINPLDLSCVIASLQRQLAHAVAYGDNADESAAGKTRFVIQGAFVKTCCALHFQSKIKSKKTQKKKSN